MKIPVISFILLLLTATLSAQSADSSRFEVLGQKLSEYYGALRHESLDVQKRECDFLIESTTDSLLRQFVALDIYGHYVASPVMGAENVAVHVYDKWLADGKIKFRTEADRMAAQVYAMFNRQSLIGENAPSLVMESPDGASVTLFNDEGSGRFRVLYFYDTDCAKCLVETILLRNLLAAGKYPVDLYAVYVGDDRQDWESYVSQKFTFEVPDVHVRHFWDPLLKSDFQLKYGVTGTPRLFLVGPDGVILGRGLNTGALEKLLDGIFTASSEKPSAEEVKGIADYIHDRTLAVGDTLMFRQLAEDYLYYLSTRSGEGIKEGLRYHIDKNILSQDKVWTTADDSLKVIGMAQIMADLLSRAAVGTRIPAVKVPGELYTWRGNSSVVRRLDRLKGDRNIIIFYTEGCEVCAAEKSAALKLVSSGTKPVRGSSGGINVFMVNVDDLMTSDPSLASRLMDSFDLSALPFLISTDRHGIVTGRYLSLE